MYSDFAEMEDDIRECLKDGMTSSEISAHLDVSVIDVLGIYESVKDDRNFLSEKEKTATIPYIGNCVNPKDLNLLIAIDEEMKEIQWGTFRKTVGDNIMQFFPQYTRKGKPSHIKHDPFVSFYKAHFLWCGMKRLFYILMHSGIHYVWSNDIIAL